jgi:hypothetical protein
MRNVCGAEGLRANDLLAVIAAVGELQTQPAGQVRTEELAPPAGASEPASR